MAIFTKTETTRNTLPYTEYLDETTRVETDFTINSFKNVHKNYRLKESNCVPRITIEPDSDDYSHVVVQPQNLECAPDRTCYEYLVIDDEISHAVCDPDRNIEQAPFVLATKGIVFRRRGTPYFTTLGNPEGYIS
jgi:hypothetical protein